MKGRLAGRTASCQKLRNKIKCGSFGSAYKLGERDLVQTLIFVTCLTQAFMVQMRVVCRQYKLVVIVI